MSIREPKTMAAIIISGKGGNVGSLNRAENKTRPETNEETERGRAEQERQQESKRTVVSFSRQ